MKKKGVSDYIKANRKGQREAQLEVSVGWVAKDRPHKNKKKYDRKQEKQNFDSSAFSVI